MTALPSIADIAAWYDENGLSETAWLDRSGGGHDLPAVGVPVVVPNALNGKAVARFTFPETTNFFDGAVTPLGLNPGAFSIFAVVKRRSHDTGWFFTVSGNVDNYVGAYWLNIGADVVPLIGEIYVNDVDHGYDFSEPEDANATRGLDVWQVIEIVLADHATGPRYFIDGVEILSGALLGYNGESQSLPFGDFSFDHLSIGTFSTVYAEGTSADVALLGATTSVMSDADRLTLYAWLNTEFGLALPVEADANPAVLAAITRTVSRELNGAIQLLPEAFIGETPEELDDAIRVVADRAEDGAVTFTPLALREYLEANA